jgi:phenylacetate-CoA ligase
MRLLPCGLPAGRTYARRDLGYESETIERNWRDEFSKRKIYMNPRRIYDTFPDVLKDGLGHFLRTIPTLQWKPTVEEMKYHAHLKEWEWKTASELQELQLCKLSRLLSYAYTHVPYYRRVFQERGLVPNDISSLGDLHRLPLLTKEEIRRNPEDFISSEFADPRTRTAITTGGSTGTPMKFYFDSHMIGVRRAHWWRWSEFSGVNLYKDRMIYCGGAPRRWVYSPSEYRGIVNYQRNQLLLSSAVMSDSVLDRYISDMQKFRGDYIRGYASGVFMLATRLRQRGLVIPMKAVLTSSDTLFPQYRSVIQEAFCCRVFDHYGQNEDSITATECVFGEGMHINVESCIVETVDQDGQCVHGKEGRLVSTHLENRVMPLVRYVVGDVGTLGDSSTVCRCGRRHSMIDKFTGRDDEIIVTPDGRRVGCGSMNQPMKSMHGSIIRCQFIQQSLDVLVAKVVPTPQWREPQDRNEFIANTRRQVGDSIKIEVHLVSEIVPRSNGKYRFIVSDLTAKGERR